MIKDGKLICEKCDKFNCCAWFSKIKPFTDYARNPLPVEIDITNCPMYNEKNTPDPSEV